MHELYLPYTKSGASLYLGQVWIAVTLRWGKFVYLGRVCKCRESSVLPKNMEKIQIRYNNKEYNIYWEMYWTEMKWKVSYIL